MRRFYSPRESFDGLKIALGADETRHLRDVLRLHEGDEVSVFDGLGGEFRCSILSIGKRSAGLAVIKETTPAAPESNLLFTLAAAVVNGEKFDLVIQKAVELGVTIFVPLQTARSDVKLKDAAKRLKRWTRIALEATKQCGRARLMHIVEPLGFAEFIEGCDAKTTMLFSERDGAGFSTRTPREKITAVIGPKGGWDDAELALAAERGVKIVTLGGRILRAETAAITIAAVIQHRFGDLK